jgi:hypothetical protein
MSHACGRVCPFNLKSLGPVGLALLVAGLAHPGTQTVPCSGSGGGPSGLVASIETANSTPGANTINLTPGCVYALSALYPGESVNGLPPITGIITINGYGATIERSHAAGTPSLRIFAVTSGGDLTLNNVTVKGGEVFHNDLGSSCEDLGAPPPDEVRDIGWGGGLCVEGTLTLNHSTVTENTAINNEDHSALGGAIYIAQGNVTLNHSVINGNRVIGNPGAARFSSGGGIYNAGTLTLMGSTVTHNTVETLAGGFDSDFGGGIVSAGRLTMYESVVSYNTAKTSGFAPRAFGGGIVIDLGSSAMLDRCVVRNNVALAEGTGEDIDILAEGGGIGILGTATLKHSLVFSNTATVGASDNGTAEGGGIAIDAGFEPPVTATVTLDDTILHCNTARALKSRALGGGLYNSTTGLASLNRSRVVANTAQGNAIANSLGGGIYNANSVTGSVTLTQTQVKGNHPDQCDPMGSVTGCSN